MQRRRAVGNGASVRRADTGRKFAFESGNFGSLGYPAAENDPADGIRLLFIKQGLCNRNHRNVKLYYERTSEIRDFYAAAASSLV